MPIYEYLCPRCDHKFEAFHYSPFANTDWATCPECAKLGDLWPARKITSAPAVHFKGSGFYATDYGKKKETD